MARKIRERKIKAPNVTIIGEGLTERCYFKHLKSLKGYRYTCKPRNFSQQSIDDLQKQIDKVLTDDGVAVCVFDADVAREKPAERKKLEAMQKKYAGNEQVILCDSMPYIEFWFLIHYLNTNKYFASSADVIKILRRYLPDFSKHEIYLSKEKWVVDMIADGKQDTAMERAKAFGMTGESYSNIYKAFEKFAELE
jgi:hypothetical protein